MVKPPPRKPAPALTPENEGTRRRHQRADLALKARFLTDTGDERTGVVLNISAGGAMLRAKRPPAFGQGVVLYIDQVGRFAGKVVRTSPTCFAVSFEKKRENNTKIADQLTHVVNSRRRGATDRRTSPRIKSDAPAKVFFEDGREVSCTILDISLTGASLEVSPRPPLGMHLILGRMTAKVVRRHEKGVGVVFTGSAERMDDVIAEASALDFPDTTGPGIAHPFGKKGVRA